MNGKLIFLSTRAVALIFNLLFLERCSIPPYTPNSLLRITRPLAVGVREDGSHGVGGVQSARKSGDKVGFIGQFEFALSLDVVEGTFVVESTTPFTEAAAGGDGIFQTIEAGGAGFVALHGIGLLEMGQSLPVVFAISQCGALLVPEHQRVAVLGHQRIQFIEPVGV
ncbi:MAG: hypothetical protein RI977_1158 [Bacteroidota bacterium]